MAMLRCKIRWTIPGAGTAFSVLHFRTKDGSTPTQADADEVVSKVAAYATSIKAVLPGPVKLDVLNEVEEINVSNGDLIGFWSGPAQTQISGQGAIGAAWAAPAGAVISWSTAIVRRKRRIRGRTFVVPMVSTAFDSDGTLTSTALSTLNTAATNLRADGPEVALTIWGRPSGPDATDGVEGQVLSHRVPDMAAILTSRRS